MLLPENVVETKRPPQIKVIFESNKNERNLLQFENSKLFYELN
jgi:hypothetical protein